MITEDEIKEIDKKNSQQSITFKLQDDKLQKSCSITVTVGDRFKDGRGFVWECTSISYGHISFSQYINIEYVSWWTPACQRYTPGYVLILNYEQAKMILQCPVYNWTRNYDPIKTIQH
jgi:hypothetical protein